MPHLCPRALSWRSFRDHLRTKTPKGNPNGGKSPEKGDPKFYAKIDAEKIWKMMPKLKPNGGQDRLKIQKYAKKVMAKIDAEI